MTQKPDDSKRVIDSLEYKRKTDEVWDAEAEINSHKMLYIIYNELKDLKDKVHSMEEMFSVWTNTKGFITTVSIIGRSIKWLVVVGAAIGSIWYLIKRIIHGL